MAKNTIINGLSDLEKKALSKLDQILDDVCEPRILPLKNTCLVLFVTSDGSCFIGDLKTRIEHPTCWFKWQGRDVPAIKINKTAYIIPR